ncbi:hypothetical protein PTSG_05352 [Salpingoeca rosetta]|uniref:RING-type E3 ubiquitin transferase n=1 Tax=Salpingoeca rosetta (strain ATCC 50818 / BSB-021) TaxID=946362 RepID=F2UA67_SALR5|nr:uncharacterized protein PTSG_05352 [Salpingoeca rosetta]EGD73642.1 hypothetical protein PTSG_05352 [Salpingoeca rosetta]|eukprot:XP_004993923.1 hypothetical protein PTSG_05352 [Salpingoeca rosetta]
MSSTLPYSWEVMIGVHGSNEWSRYDEETQEDLEAAFRRHLANPGNPAHLDLLLCKGIYSDKPPTYKVNFSAFTQQNIHTGYVRAIRRRPVPAASTLVSLYFIDRNQMLEYVGPENSAAIQLTGAPSVWLNFGPYGYTPGRYMVYCDNMTVLDTNTYQILKLTTNGQDTCSNLHIPVQPSTVDAPSSSTSTAPAPHAQHAPAPNTSAPAQPSFSHTDGVVPSSSTPSSSSSSSSSLASSAPKKSKVKKHGKTKASASAPKPGSSNNNTGTGTSNGEAGSSSKPVTYDPSTMDVAGDPEEHRVAFPVQTRALRRDTHGGAFDASLTPLQKLAALHVAVEPVTASDDRCPVCMASLVPGGCGDTTDEDDDDEFGDPIRLPCKHMFHDGCIAMCIKGRSFKCPVCPTTYGEPPMGDMPDGQMFAFLRPQSLPGFPDTETIEIAYSIPHGTQEDHHPEPGRRFAGTSRVAYLPNTPKGRKVFKLLKRAFEYRHTFTVNHSITLGPHAGMRVVWAGIHHKTDFTGTFGYPDETYLDRVQQELKDFGITL